MHALINKGGAAVAFAPASDCLQVPATGYILNHEPPWQQLEDIFSYFDFVLAERMAAVIHLVFQIGHWKICFERWMSLRSTCKCYKLHMFEM